MPTTRPRHVITETDRVARALDDAAKRWPEDQTSRAKLLLHLVEEGHRSLTADAASERLAYLEAIGRTAGALDGVYGADDLDRLHAEWPV